MKLGRTFVGQDAADTIVATFMLIGRSMNTVVGQNGLGTYRRQVQRLRQSHPNFSALNRSSIALARLSASNEQVEGAAVSHKIVRLAEESGLITQLRRLDDLTQSIDPSSLGFCLAEWRRLVEQAFLAIESAAVVGTPASREAVTIIGFSGYDEVHPRVEVLLADKSTGLYTVLDIDLSHTSPTTTLKWIDSSLSKILLRLGSVRS